MRGMVIRLLVLFLLGVSYCWGLDIYHGGPSSLSDPDVNFEIRSHHEVYTPIDDNGNEFQVISNTEGIIHIYPENASCSNLKLLFVFDYGNGYTQFKYENITVDWNGANISSHEFNASVWDYRNKLVNLSCNACPCNILITTYYKVRGLVKSKGTLPWEIHTARFYLPPLPQGNQGKYVNVKVDIYYPKNYNFVLSDYSPDILTAQNNSLELRNTPDFKWGSGYGQSIALEDRNHNTVCVPFFWAFIGAIVGAIVAALIESILNGLYHACNWFRSFCDRLYEFLFAKKPENLDVHLEKVENKILTEINKEFHESRNDTRRLLDTQTQRLDDINLKIKQKILEDSKLNSLNESIVHLNSRIQELENDIKSLKLKLSKKKNQK